MGEKFTCSNKQSGNTKILTWLDWVRANPEWTTFHPYAKVYHQDLSLSDHILIWTDTTHDKEKFSNPFKFQNHGTFDEGLHKLIKKIGEALLRILSLAC